MFLIVFGSEQSDVREGTSMTTCCVVNSNRDSGEPGNQYCMTKHGSSYPQIVYWLRVSGVWNYPIGWAYIKWGRDKRLTWLYGFGAFMVNRCAVLWCGRDLWVETAQSHLPCFALRRKTTPNKQRAAKRIKWPWSEPRLLRKSNNRPKFT